MNPETAIQKNLCTPMFTAAQFTIVERWKQPKCPSRMSGSKNHGTFTQWNTMQQKEKFLPFMTAWMELEGMMLNEISQVVKNKYHMISPIA